MGKMRITYFRSEDVEDALSWLKESCYILREFQDATPTIYTTGIGSNQGATNIQDKLRVK